jgi:hypothetical protein
MYMLMRKPNKLSLDQQGFASIVIALVLIIVLSLLTVGFAELARREQQNALDKQLASQAYYAAESGVNDVTQAVKQAISNPSGTPTSPSLNSLTPQSAGGLLDPNSCLESQTGADPDLNKLPNYLINSTNIVEYSCVLLNLQPPSLVKSPLSPNSAWSITFTAETPHTNPLANLVVSWNSLKGNGPRATGGFDPVSSWNAMAVLQVSITPLADVSRNGLFSNTYTTYLYPENTGGIADYSSRQPLANASCPAVASGPVTCSVIIAGLNSAPSFVDDEQYLMTIYDYYDTSSVSITNAKAADGTALNFADGQALVDVTGQDKEVLKRIQVHVPINGTVNTLPSYALQAQNICKRIDAAPIVPTTNPNGTTYESAGGVATPSPLPSSGDPCSFDGDLTPN